MIYLAELAQAAADRLDPGQVRPEVIADTQARVWAELGNAYRLADLLDRAEAAFKSAVDALDRGSGDPLLAARIADRFASLLAHRRRFPDAFALLDRLATFYVSQGERHLAGRALITRGAYAENAGDPETAIRYTLGGLELIQPERDATLLLSARAQPGLGGHRSRPLFPRGGVSAQDPPAVRLQPAQRAAPALARRAAGGGDRPRRRRRGGVPRRPRRLRRIAVDLSGQPGDDRPRPALRSGGTARGDHPAGRGGHDHVPRPPGGPRGDPRPPAPARACEDTGQALSRVAERLVEIRRLLADLERRAG